MEKDRQSQQLRDATDVTRSLRLLVVEDHSDLRWALQAFVEALGYDARFVESAASALHAVREQPYDVLLCDIDLPDGNGWDLLKQMEADGHRPPHAIAMSVFNLGEDVARSITAGFVLHLFKPFPPGDLKKALDVVPARSVTPVSAR